MQRALVIVEPEQERADHRARAVLVPPKTGDDTISRTRMLDLDHRPLARAIGSIETLRHHTIEPRAFKASEPILGKRAVAGGRRQMHRRLSAAERAFESFASLGERRLA